MAYYLNFFMLYGVPSEQLFSYLLDRYKGLVHAHQRRAIFFGRLCSVTNTV